MGEDLTRHQTLAILKQGQFEIAETVIAKLTFWAEAIYSLADMETATPPKNGGY